MLPCRTRCSLVTLALFVFFPTASVSAETPTGVVELAPHRAIYDLKLGQSRGKRGLEGVRGRILYDFEGSRCEGYALQFRQVTELESGEGENVLSDLRTSNWEEGDGKSFRFTVQNFLGGREVDGSDGLAGRGDNGVSVSLTKPEKKKAQLGAVIFPSEHMRRVIEAAREGKTLLEAAVFDGSETGEKVYNTLTVIGHAIAPEQSPPKDAAAGQASLAHLTRWPVTVSYFDRAKADQSGEQTPAYAISFELYENGVSRALKIDYGDFVVTGEMTSLDMKPAKPCK
ncbi:MAG: cell envelope integrity EipB family protein [Rhizobiales bacterium]|nr:cell envelope integrity EipB family protein [Hyphomicrobiales bacterium]